MLKKKIRQKEFNTALLLHARSGCPAEPLHSFNRWQCICLTVCVLLLGACATPPPPGSISALNEPGVFKNMSPDADIMHEGITFLGDSGKANDYVKARAAFDTLIKTYPESKWRRLAETLIHLIDTMQSCREKDLLANKDEQEVSRLVHDNDRLQKQIRQLNEKLRTETTRLLEENEQLKKDIRLLKDLEVELEKRDKMLR